MVRHAPEWRRQQRRSANRTKSETWSANLAGLDHEGSTCSTRDTNPGLKLHAATNTVIQRLDRARFQPEVRFQRPQWFFDIDADWWNPEPIEAVAYLTRLFEGPEEPLYWFTDAQIAQGLTYLVSTSASGDNGWLYSTDVPVADRIHCVDSSVSLFAKLFLPRCAPHLSHLSEPATGPLNVVCYMWWDEFPCLALPGDPALSTMHQHALLAMERILSLDSLACQESTLHGLGHWQRQYPAQVNTIVDRFLGNSVDLNARLVAYAKSARSGCVL